MLPEFDQQEIARLRALLDGEHHLPRLIAVLAGLPGDVAYRLTPEDIDLPARMLHWTLAGPGGEVAHVAHIGQRLVNALVLAVQEAVTAERRLPGSPVFAAPSRPPAPPDWLVWRLHFLAPAHRGRHAAWQIALSAGRRSGPKPPPHRALEHFARRVSDYWGEGRLASDATDPEGEILWTLVTLDDGRLDLRPRSKPRPIP